ncbi:MAG: DUF2752 domain-containing protein [Clostridia bacterium]|nr:DUF2752 domain-containing protein [Clostridia bacterium]
MRNIFNRIKSDIHLLWRPVLLVAVVLIVLQVIFNEICPMKIIFGVPCPACGLTHSCIYIIMLQWKKAWLYNPTGFLWFISIFLGLVYRYILGKRSSIIMGMFILSSLASVIVYLYKLQMFLALHIVI